MIALKGSIHFRSQKFKKLETPLDIKALNLESSDPGANCSRYQVAIEKHNKTAVAELLLSLG